MSKKKYMRTLLAATLLFNLSIPLAGAHESHSEEAEQHEHAHDHDHSNCDHDHHHHEKKPHQEGIFEDSEVKDRDLKDYSGEWQSVYPYLKSGDLDMVFRNKASKDDSKTFEEYKEYYTKGYETDIDHITIDGEKGQITFHKGDEAKTATYKYDGYKILTYESGKKGVRYLFTATDNPDGAPKFVQFSDHEIAPTKSHHFHIFFGDSSQEEILKEMDNWPTYYPANLDAHGIVDEMLAH